MADHIVQSFDQDLEYLRQRIVEMGAVAEQMQVDALQALTKLDPELARRVIVTDQQLDRLQREIEDHTVVTIARRQPVAVDLRQLIGAIHIAACLERVGDLAKNIAKRVINVRADERLPRASVGLRHMGDVARRQLEDVLQAYVSRDKDRAHSVWLGDAELDELEDVVFRDLLTFMMEDPHNISFCANLLFCAKNIERIGDHATNIAENVYYIVTGEYLPIDRPKPASDNGTANIN